MIIDDKILLDTYMWGFNDGLDMRVETVKLNSLLLKAYKLGRQDAFSESTYHQTNQQILHRIRS